MKDVVMLPVDKDGDAWVVDMDPILDGEDMDWLEEVDHLPQVSGVVRGATVVIYSASATSGYVRADSIPEEG